MKHHVQHIENSVSKAINALKVMSGLSGVNAKILLRAYNGCTRAVLDYGSEAFSLLTAPQTRSLQLKQNCALKFILGVYRWAPTKNIHAELEVLPTSIRTEIFQTNMLNKFLCNTQHPLHLYISSELEAPRTRVRYKNTWLTSICKIHNKLAGHIPPSVDTTNTPPWSTISCNIITNDHLPPKQSTDPNVLRDLTTAAMSDIIQTSDNIFYTDGSVADGRTAAAFIYQGHPTLLRLNNKATVMQAELAAIKAALSRASCSPHRCVVFTDSKSALLSLSQHIPSDNVALIQSINNIADTMNTRPVLFWIPSHIGIQGNEAADLAAKQALFKLTIDVQVPTSKAKSKAVIKQTAIDIHETLTYADPSPSVKLHQQIKLSKADMKSLMNLPNRFVQRRLFHLRLFVQPYTQIVDGPLAVCPYCDDHFNVYTVHYIASCPATRTLRTQLMADVPTNMYNADDTSLTLEILRRQGARDHKELTKLIKQYPPA